MKQLECRFYSRSAIAEIVKRDPKSRHFARDVQTTLNKWGYAYKYQRTGVEVTKQPETPEERLAEILIRKLNIDIQINPKAFACFISAFHEIEHFESMPWDERAVWLDCVYGIQITGRTLRSWCNKLIEKGIISRNSQQTFWKTECHGGAKMRCPVDPDDEELQAYYQDRKNFLNENERQLLNDGLYPKAATANAWAIATLQLLEKYHCVYYTCKSLNITAFSEDEDDFLLEIYELVEEIVHAPKENAPALVLLPEAKKITTKEEFYAQWYGS